jgi:hypothetical protein
VDPDECDGIQAQCKIIELVAASIDENGLVPLRWAFFSRPEVHIEVTFAQPEVSMITHSVTLPISRDVDGEIEVYLRVGFDNILLRLGLPKDYLWPPEKDSQTLIDHSNGLFATAL